MSRLNTETWLTVAFFIYNSSVEYVAGMMVDAGASAVHKNVPLTFRGRSNSRPSSKHGRVSTTSPPPHKTNHS